MRRAALGLLLGLLLALTACSTPTGVETKACEQIWRSRDALIVQSGGVDERAVAIDCMVALDRRRMRIGFTIPAGPDCYRLSRMEISESADAVSISLFIARNEDPNAGACPDREQRVRTEVELQAEVGSRVLLDGNEHLGPLSSQDL